MQCLLLGGSPLEQTLCVIEQVGHITRMGERRVVYRVLVRKPEGKEPP